MAPRNPVACLDSCACLESCAPGYLWLLTERTWKRVPAWFLLSCCLSAFVPFLGLLTRQQAGKKGDQLSCGRHKRKKRIGGKRGTGEGQQEKAQPKAQLSAEQSTTCNATAAAEPASREEYWAAACFFD